VRCERAGVETFESQYPLYVPCQLPNQVLSDELVDVHRDIGEHLLFAMARNAMTATPPR